MKECLRQIFFSDSSGKIEGREGWLKPSGKGLFISRNHDCIKVELHKELAIAKGKLPVIKTNKGKIDRYHLYYIRAYANRENKWQMISHSTTSAFHKKAPIIYAWIKDPQWYAAQERADSYRNNNVAINYLRWQPYKNCIKSG